MSPAILIVTRLVLSTLGFYMGRKRSVALAHKVGGLRCLNSRQVYYGTLTALWCIIPAVVVVSFRLAFEPNLISGMMVAELPQQVRQPPAPRLDRGLHHRTVRMINGVRQPSWFTKNIRTSEEKWII